MMHIKAMPLHILCVTKAPDAGGSEIGWSE